MSKKYTNELDFLDEDTMTSNSDTALASQQSIKAYADNITTPALVAGDYKAMGIVTGTDHQGQTFTKVAEVTIPIGGTFRTKIGIHTSVTGTGDTTVYGAVYKNGSIIGTSRSTISTTFVYFTEDLSFVAGDLLQLYTRVQDNSRTVSGNITYGVDNPVGYWEVL